MRELHLVAHESNATSLVLCVEDSDEQFFLAVDDTLLEILTSPDAPPIEHKQDRTDEAAAPPPPAVEPPPPITVAAEHPAPERESRPNGPLTMRPREIQERIRGGASVAELAESIGVIEARIEPFAHPILLERERMAELAKHALPVRDDGPASLTLWEILATAFAARDIDLTTSKWDSYRDQSGQWVVKVSWKSGISENSAEWSYHPKGTSASPTVVARNASAADLIDPQFSRPVRSLPHFDVPTPTEQTAPIPVVKDEHTHEGDGFLENDEQPTPRGGKTPEPKRRRKAVTPHWEDVLLGVRTSTKRPRS
ncbi:septation protein SepH [Corynebacterium sp.]|uniref:septation protein SepH n=1 Tax=Corynebacterium sp. TaxID=1720 RepID=UPI0026DD42FA|nr:septation protein SepH [Corynebacterium sp.]MDO5076275.1 septation protein SepH [Corynebacterium sp.]